MSYLEIANSPLIWLACGLCVALVLFQSGLFVRKSLSAARKMNISDGQVKSAVKSSLTASIGPSLAILAGMVSCSSPWADRSRGSVWHTSAR